MLIITPVEAQSGQMVAADRRWPEAVSAVWSWKVGMIAAWRLSKGRLGQG